MSADQLNDLLTGNLKQLIVDHALVNYRLVNENICLKFVDNDYNKGGLKSPYCNFNKEIVITHEYIAFLWGVTYYLFVTYETLQTQMQAQLKETGKWDGKLRNNEDICKAIGILEWAWLLKSCKVLWCPNLPCPSLFVGLSEHDKKIVGAVNTMFIYAISYILSHEYTHITAGHVNCKFEKDDFIKQLEQKTNDFIKQLEREADAWARELMVKCDAPEERQHHIGIGIVIAHLALLYSLNDPAAIIQRQHPDLDTRLYFHLQNPAKDFYLKHLAYIGLDLFCKRFKLLNLSDQTFANVDELLNKVADFFSDIKRESTSKIL